MVFTLHLGATLAWVTIFVVVVFFAAIVRTHTDESFGGFRAMFVSGILIIILTLGQSILILNHWAN